MNQEPKVLDAPLYVGDAVYARVANGTVTLTTGSHVESEASNVIHLEVDVLVRLLTAIVSRAVEP